MPCTEVRHRALVLSDRTVPARLRMEYQPAIPGDGGRYWRTHKLSPVHWSSKENKMESVLLELVPKDAWIFCLPLAVVFIWGSISIHRILWSMRYLPVRNKGGLVALGIMDANSYEEWRGTLRNADDHQHRVVRGMRIIFGFVGTIALLTGAGSLFVYLFLSK